MNTSVNTMECVSVLTRSESSERFDRFGAYARGSFDNLNAMASPVAPAPASAGAALHYAHLQPPGTFPRPHPCNPTEISRRSQKPCPTPTSAQAKPQMAKPSPRLSQAPSKHPVKVGGGKKVSPHSHTPVKLKLKPIPLDLGVSMSTDRHLEFHPSLPLPTTPVTSTASLSEAPVSAGNPILHSSNTTSATSVKAASNLATAHDIRATIRSEILSGAAAGASVSGLLFPLNTVKTRLMMGGSLLARSTFQGLWSGARFDVLAQAASTAIFFGVYGRMKTHLADPENPGELHGMQALQAGSTAALASSLLAVPAEVVRQHVQSRSYKTTRAAFSGIVKSRGPLGLYTGYGASLARDLPFDTLQITLYEVLRKSYMAAHARTELNAAESACLGGAAGGLTGLITTPIDAVRTQAVLACGQKKVSMRLAAQQLMQKQGVRGLFKGGGARSLEIALGGMIFFTVLEHAQALLAEKPPTADTAVAAAPVRPSPPPRAQNVDRWLMGDEGLDLVLPSFA